MGYLYGIGYPARSSMQGMTKAEKAKMQEQERKWRADADLDTLIRAEEIRKDPERMKAVKELHKELSTSLARIAEAK
jgi:hypothetical protein